MQVHDWIILILLVLTLSAVIVLLVHLSKSKDNKNINNELSNNRELIINNVKSEIGSMTNSITSLFNVFREGQSEQNKLFVQHIESLIKQINENQTKSNLEIEQKLENIRKSVETSINTLKETTDTRLEKVRETIEKSINNLQAENTKKLDEMRQTVDEKLQSTLNKRISESFKTVSDTLEQVTRGLGEMQTLATGVGDLKKVLSNVKTRGILGEIQLGNILEEILIPDQYETNFATKKGSNERVEFAIKLPGDDEPVYLPVDSKFPLEDYERLLDAYEAVDTVAIEKHKKDLVSKIKSFAKGISSKYIDVPHTTEFAIMFLPIEGLYAEVVRLGLVEELQRNYKINIAGPTTMAALLNSIQMGFRSLAIQKRSSEVWKTLGAVKTEFGKFGNVLKSAQNRLNQANDELDKLVGVRTRVIQRRLRDVVELDDYDSKILIPLDEDLEN